MSVFTLFLSSMLLREAYTYNYSSSCQQCFTASSNNKFCLMNWASTAGYCCDTTNKTDYCSLTQYFCSDQAPNNAVKYSYCPFQPQLCYNKASNILVDNSLQVGATSNAFGQDDVCSWKIKANTAFFFNKQIRVKIKLAGSVDCHLAFGDSVETATNYKSCYQGAEYTISSDQ